MWKIVAGFVVTLLFVAACGGGDSDPEEPREPQVTRATVLLSPTTRITTIDTPRSDFILEFFQGAFSEDTEITIEEVPRGDQPEAIQKVGEGVAYRLGPPGLMLQSPIRVSLRPDRVDLPGDPPDGETIFAYYVAAVDEDGSGEVLDDLFMEYNADTGWIQMRGWTDRFSWIVWGRSLMHAGLEQLEPKEIAIGSSFDISYRVASRTADSGDGPLKITRADLFANGAIDIQTGTEQRLRRISRNSRHERSDLESLSTNGEPGVSTTIADRSITEPRHRLWGWKSPESHCLW